MTAPEAARGRQTATAGKDGQTINHAQQGRQGRPAAPRGDDQRRGRVTMARISSHAEHRRRWQRAGSARAVSTINAPRGCSCMAAGRIGDAGALDNQQKTR